MKQMSQERLNVEEKEISILWDIQFPTAQTMSDISNILMQNEPYSAEQQELLMCGYTRILPQK